MQYLGLLVSFAGGIASWWLLEYVMHYYAFHVPKGKWFGSRQHLDHHARANWIWDWLIFGVWILVVLIGVGIWRFGTLIGHGEVLGCIGAGLVFGYFFYEYHHAMSHLRGPKNRWERWVRRNHLYHHFGHPMKNQGVTVPFFDRLMGTSEMPEKVRVPRRLIPVWMGDENGEILERYCDDYELVGALPSGAKRNRGDDVERAYANLVPQVDAEV